jgi:hypothetical protein
MEKSKNTFKAAKKYEADVVMMGEVGLNMLNLNDEDSMHARVKNVLHAPKAIFECNKHHQSTSPCLHGGVGIVATFEATTRYKGVGNDPTGLARWVLVLCEGRSNHKLRFVYAHNPCYSTGLNTVYQQHVHYLDLKTEMKHHMWLLKRTSRQHCQNGLTMAMNWWFPSMQIRM